MYCYKITKILWKDKYGKQKTIILEENNEEPHSELSQTSEMELFAKMVASLKSLDIFGKSSILDVCQGSD